MERTVLNKEGSYGASVLVEASLYDYTLCRAVRVRLEFLHLGNKKYCFEKLIYIHLCNSRNGHAYRVAAPLLGDEVIFGQLLHDAVGGHAGFIHLVYSDDYVNSGCLCVVDSLDGLRHDSVICSDNENCDIRSLRAARSHRGERRMAGSIEESYLLAVEVNSVCANVLGDTARLCRGDIGMAYSVKKRGLAVVNMTHDNNDRVSRRKILCGVVGIVDYSVLYSDNDFLFGLCAELGRDYRGGVVVDDLVDSSHNAEGEQLLDNFSRSHFEHGGEVGDNYLIGYFYDYLRLLRAFCRYTGKALSLGLAARGTHALLAVLRGALLELLLVNRLVALHAVVGRGYILIALVVLVELDIAGSRVNGSALALCARLHRLVIILLFGSVLCRLRRLLLRLCGGFLVLGGGLCILCGSRLLCGLRRSFFLLALLLGCRSLLLCGGFFLTLESKIFIEAVDRVLLGHGVE